MNNNSEQQGEWGYLWSEVVRRTKEPFSHVTFVLHAIVAIVGFGCLGVWVEAYKVYTLSLPDERMYDGLLTAILTFTPALTASSALQFFLVCYDPPSNKILGYSGLMFGFLLVVLSGYMGFSGGSATIPSIVCAALLACLALWFWWMTEADNSAFRPTPSDAASGGDPNKDPKGNTEGFKK